MVRALVMVRAVVMVRAAVEVQVERQVALVVMDAQPHCICLNTSWGLVQLQQLMLQLLQLLQWMLKAALAL